MEIVGFTVGCYKKETLLFQSITLQHIQCICCCNLPRGFTNMQMLCLCGKNRLTRLWSYGLPLKQRVFLWRCLFGVLPTGSNLRKRSIALLHCARCGGWLEIVPHLLWTCLFTATFVQRLSASLYHRFPGQRFGKHFWTTCPIRQCLFSPMDTILGTLDHLDSPQL